MAKKIRKRSAAPKKAQKRRPASARKRGQTGANDPLFVPHPRALAQERLERSTAADPYVALLESICGATDDSQAVEQYDGTLGVTTAFVAAHNPRPARSSGTTTWRRSTRIPATSQACAGAAGR